MDITKDIQRMTTFRNHSAVIMEHLNDTKRRFFLTVNAKGVAVVHDAEAYQCLLGLATEASVVEGRRQGHDHVCAGRSPRALQIFDDNRGGMGYSAQITARASHHLRRFGRCIKIRHHCWARIR